MYFLPIIGTTVTNLIELGNISNQILVLADNIGDNYYTRFYKENHQLVIIDNMIYEKEEAVDIDTLLEKAKQVGATEIVVPDVLYNGQKTIQSAHDFIWCLSKEDLNKYDLMAVAQGRDVQDYIKCLIDLSTIDEILTLGFSCLAIPHVMKTITGTIDVMTNRVMLVQWLQASGLLRSNMFIKTKNWHLLGLGTNTAELTYMRPYFRSCDSSLPFVAAQYKVKLAEGLNEYSIKERHHNLEEPLSDERLQLARQNIELCITLSEGKK